MSGPLIAEDIPALNAPSLFGDLALLPAGKLVAWRDALPLAVLQEIQRNTAWPIPQWLAEEELRRIRVRIVLLLDVEGRSLRANDVILSCSRAAASTT